MTRSRRRFVRILCRSVAVPFLAFLILFADRGRAAQTPGSHTDEPWLRPCTGPTRTDIDPTTLDGKVLCGYQGWFNTPGDGTDFGFGHWGRGLEQPGRGRFTVDMWPDVSEYAPQDLREVPGLKMPDGSPALLYSNFRKGPVLVHCKWMRQYGIDGVFLSRFVGETTSPARARHVNTVLANVREGCHREGRVWALMLDLSMGRGATTALVMNDWKFLCDQVKVREDARYLHHHNKPVVLLWGLGFKDRPWTPEQGEELVNFFKNDPHYGGVYLIGGIDPRWRTLSGASRTDPAWAKVYRMFDAISPWDAGRYRDDVSMDRFRKDVWEGDLAELKTLRIGYMPTAFPGFSWDNLRRTTPGTTMIARRKGEFYWRQFAIFKTLGIRTVFVGMFDEVNEGTAIYKVSNQIPEGKYFVTYEGLPSDWYLKLTGAASRMIRGAAPLSEKIPAELAIHAVSTDDESTATKPAEASSTFSGEKTAWHGFDRYDFLMDQATLAIKPIKAATDEKNSIRNQVKGQWRCVVVVPRQAATGKPWSWRGCYFDHEPQAEIELLKRGFHIGFIMSDPGKSWDAWYTFLTQRHGLSRKPAFVGMSRGGFNAFAWATANPDKVSCIYADNPAISRDSLMKLGELVKHDVPLLHVCGSLDPILGKYTLVIESIYQQLGGRISVMIKDGAAHHPHSLRDPRPIADFIVHSLQPKGSTPPAFAGKNFTKSAYYGVENSYRDWPSEKTYTTCRGPWFTQCYDRYDFRLDGIKGSVGVIVPKTAAPGKPWVFRADFTDRDAVIDLALLAWGFHIVTGPVPTDTNGPVLEQWNAVYEHLTNHGLARKVVMEGAGGAAGEAYAWSIANPARVACIYGENPILRSNMSKSPPLDNLAPLARAGVPLLHVCGSLDPWLTTQTRVVAKRYQELGGPITVVINEGAGHYPLAPKDRQPVVDFIVKSVK